MQKNRESKNLELPNENRRDFLKKSGIGLFFSLPLALAANQLVFRRAAQAQKDEKLVMIKPTDPTAQALGYYEEASKVDTKKWPKRAGAEGAKQFCYNCLFYQVKGEPKKTKAGPCTIFGGKGVAAMGWCNSWALNPKVKD